MKRDMWKLAISGAVVLAAIFASAPSASAQDDTPSLTTEDVLKSPQSVTNANAAAAEAAAAAKAEADAEAATGPAPAAPGYTKFVAPSGYAFDRPAEWTPVKNLEPQGAPSAFTYDAVFQDAKTGAVVSAVSVDKSQLGDVFDIGDANAVNKLLSTMLNPANLKQGVKIFRQVTGDGPHKTKWLRIKAQGNAQATDGRTVDTTFWVQIVQSDAHLALVAVGYPSAREKDASLPAFHSVKTLEMPNDGRTAPAGSDAADDGKTAVAKDGAGRVREQ